MRDEFGRTTNNQQLTGNSDRGSGIGDRGEQYVFTSSRLHVSRTTHHASRLMLLILFAVLLGLIIGCQEGEQPTATAVSSTNNLETVTPTAEATDTAETEATESPEPTGEVETEAEEQETAVPTSTPVPEDTNTPEPPTPTATRPGPGALVGLQMNSTVGILLDEIPESDRDRIADQLLDRPAEYWQDLARQQVLLTYNRLHFRPFFYQMLKWQLPLPPQSLWEINVDTNSLRRETVQNHDYVLIDYNYNSTLLTDQESPAVAEPNLAEIGGTWTEPFVLPLDPTQLLQRTDNACVNEGGFPPESFDSENIFLYYDYSCQADSAGATGCHRSRLANLSCIEALSLRVGWLETGMQFERLRWNRSLADQVRVGNVLSADTPDLSVVTDDLESNRIVYRYFTPNSCAAQEQCITGTGWRRLLMFEATAHNQGAAPLDIGRVIVANPLNELFQYNSCHDHFHFTNYGEFQLGENNQPSKQAFCVESTGRYSNNETSPLTHDYTCSSQGIQAGWADEYVAGLDCQWIDITDATPDGEDATLPLTFRFNQDMFLCEGDPIVNENGELQWEPTGLRTADGLPLNRPQCEFVEGWDSNNEGTIDVFVPAVGSFVNQPCTNGEFGPLRNCDFLSQPLPPLPTPTPIPTPDPDDDEEVEVDEEPIFRCEPNQPVRLTCTLADEDAAPQVLRVCETSNVLGIGTACTYETALLTSTITSEGRDITFTCPRPRDENEPGGDYAFYTASVSPDDERSVIECVPTTD